ncbi:EGF-like domain protein [Dictyocaulus viviparus]|uniref:EGF-like domain protein n=1 Tax=Dictyocaulus viviparus TaxID=29172 RepID=A0A0D8XVX4_DICVI|nr:EGF-like domain protein [Dictyocaulus viviparus]
MTLDVFYAGLAPSTSHPSRFDGCLREVQLNGEVQRVSAKGKVRRGCVVPNRCVADGMCPKESSCHKEWNGHSCRCHRGFVGDTCSPVCSLIGICGPNGFCLSSNESKGYYCQCQEGFVGKNCERSTAVQICPPSYWGVFPHCKKCSCPEGFDSQCIKENGNCRCPRFQFALNGRCVNCECGYGASTLQCSLDGQCQCSGEATGRRCDRCMLDNHKWLANDCKLLTDFGFQDESLAIKLYSSSISGSRSEDVEVLARTTARQSCPDAQTGLATRSCSGDGHWLGVNSFNCTRPEYSLMVYKVSSLSPRIKILET